MVSGASRSTNVSQKLLTLIPVAFRDHINDLCDPSVEKYGSDSGFKFTLITKESPINVYVADKIPKFVHPVTLWR